jgi:hypothetical protein
MVAESDNEYTKFTLDFFLKDLTTNLKVTI